MLPAKDRRVVGVIAGGVDEFAALFTLVLVLPNIRSIEREAPATVGRWTAAPADRYVDTVGFQIPQVFCWSIDEGDRIERREVQANIDVGAILAGSGASGKLA